MAADLPPCSTAVLRTSTPVSAEQGVFPEPGERTSEAGQTMMYRGPIGRYPAAIILPKGARYDGTALRSSKDQVVVPPGRYSVSRVDRNDIGFVASAVRPEDGEGNIYITGAVRLVLLKNNGRLYVFWNRSPGTMDWKAGVPAGDFSVDYCLGPAGGGFRSELVYLGFAQNRLKLSYREYSPRGSRATATEDLEFDLAEGRTIAVKGARLEVLDVGNQGIRYRVLSPLD